MSEFTKFTKNESDLNNNIHLKIWASAFNSAIIRAYKVVGRYRISAIQNEIDTMEKTCFIRTNEDIDAYNAQIDKYASQMERVEACMNDDSEQNGIGISALFHGHEAVSNEDDGMVKMLSDANFPDNLYYDYYDDYDDGENSIKLKINVRKQGFDLIYDYMMNHPLFSRVENKCIKNELQTMRAMIIMEICKNDVHQIKRVHRCIVHPYH